ncbi:MAG: magnesium chelatase subunit H [Planctomycetes bacterium]|nr:magnesium chelatase subunit H [Planctomycetota bacterium]
MSKPFRILLATQELSRPALVRRAWERLPGDAQAAIRFESLTTESASDEALTTAVSEADLVVASHVLVDADARRLIAALDQRPDPSVLVLNSLRPLLLRTRLGPFTFQRALPLLGRGDGPMAAIGRLFGEGDMTETIRELRSSLPGLVQHLPKEATGLSLWLRATLYWSEPTPQNLASLLLMLTDELGPERGRWKAQYDDPVLSPLMGIWDRQRGLLEDRSPRRLGSQAKGRVALLLVRGNVLSGDTAAGADLIAALEARGLDVTPIFSDVFDFRPALQRFGDLDDLDGVINATGFPLVGGHNRCAADDSANFLAEHDLLYFTPPVLMTQSQDAWADNRLGLSPMEIAMELSMHELEGGIEPILIGGTDASGLKTGMQDRIDRFSDRVAKWITLRRRPVAERRVFMTIFAFPPGKGAVGTAAYLDVMQSSWRILRRLADAGYRVEVPDSAQELLDRVLMNGDQRRPVHGAQLAVGANLSVADYEGLDPATRRIEKQWGPPPGNLETDGRDLLIAGLTLGNVFLSVQPSFGYEGDPMRLLFDKGATPHHGFFAHYLFAERVWEADVLLHLGTHGALEFMPGKQTGLSSDCWPDRLVGTLPHVYVYAVNNPSEGTIAKRRAQALTVTYLTPPADQAGLYRDLVTMRDLVLEWHAETDPNRRRRSLESLIALAAENDLESDVTLPAHVEDDEAAQRFVSQLSVALTEIETRRIPLGLHVLGREPARGEREEILASFMMHERPERGLASWPRLVLEGRGDLAEDFLVRARARDEDAVRFFARAEADARVLAARVLDESTASALQLANELATGLDEVAMADLLAELAPLDAKLRSSDELTSVLRALDGRRIAPGPGGDPVRQPDVLPTGRNLHALDPGRVPSPAAQCRAEETVDVVLERLVADQGRMPKSMGLVLWGLDNIKTQGEAIAQALYLLGVRARANSIGRMSELEIIDLATLGRPRIDVVCQCSGIFRDIFQSAMELIDRAVRLVADLDEPEDQNPIRARALTLERDRGFSKNLSRARVFSNSPGAYGTNIDHMVQLSTWEDRDDLARIFARRKGFLFGEGLAGERAPELLEALAEGIEATFQNVDSTEVSITDVDHYFEYLGGLTALAEQKRGQRPPALVADATSGRVQVRSLAEAVRLESRTRLLNPKWYEALLEHGHEGAEEIRKRLEYTFGWSATTDAVPDWVYREAQATFVDDAAMATKMKDANLHAFESLVRRLQEAAARGFYEPDAAQAQGLEATAQDLDDAIEGVA